MNDDLILATISNIGVPTAICFYVIASVKSELKDLNKNIVKWCQLIERRLERLEDDVRELQHRQP